jgi:hypothetical protein
MIKAEVTGDRRKRGNRSDLNQPYYSGMERGERVTCITRRSIGRVVFIYRLERRNPKERREAGRSGAEKERDWVEGQGGGRV